MSRRSCKAAVLSIAFLHSIGAVDATGMGLLLVLDGAFRQVHVLFMSTTWIICMTNAVVYTRYLTKEYYYLDTWYDVHKKMCTATSVLVLASSVVVMFRFSASATQVYLAGLTGLLCLFLSSYELFDCRKSGGCIVAKHQFLSYALYFCGVLSVTEHVAMSHLPPKLHVVVETICAIYAFLVALAVAYLEILRTSETSLRALNQLDNATYLVSANLCPVKVACPYEQTVDPIFHEFINDIQTHRACTLLTISVLTVGCSMTLVIIDILVY